MYFKHLCLLFTAVTAIIIPREKLISDNSFSSIEISPDGKTIGYVGPDNNNIKNVFVWRISDRKKTQVTFEKTDVLNFDFTGVQDVIVFSLNRNGDENLMQFKKNISESTIMQESTVISNKQGVRSLRISNFVSKSYIHIAVNDDNPAFFNIYKFDLNTNELSRVLTNTRFSEFIADHNMNIRLVKERKEDGSVVYYRLSLEKATYPLTSEEQYWEEYIRVQPDETESTNFLGFDKTNENTYWIWGEDSDLGQLIEAPIGNFSKRQVLYTAKKAPITNMIFDEAEHTILGYSEYYHKPEMVYIHPSIVEDMQYVKNLKPAGSPEFKFSKDMQTWLICFKIADGPDEVYIYRRLIKSAELLFNMFPDLEGYSTYKQIGFDFTARDGLTIQAYLSLPPETPLKTVLDVPDSDKKMAESGMIPVNPQKLVVHVHGGPTQSRDNFGFKKVIAMLTSRGYAVLQVNFRGSYGFGKRFTNAGNGEWSRKMHYDLLDGVDFIIEKGIANRSAIAIMGVSYGGYATLVGLTFTPDVFACGIDVVGPSNLVSLLNSLPPYWYGLRQQYIKWTGGDVSTEEGREELIARSPLFLADRVKKPLMIMQGANDPRVKQAESDQFDAAMRKHSIPVTYILYPDEGHGFRRTANILAQYGFTERFLHNCLGGDYEPFTVGQYNSSAIESSHSGDEEETTSDSVDFMAKVLSIFLSAFRIINFL